MDVGRSLPSPLWVEYGERKIVGNSSKSTDGHCGINAWKRQTSRLTDPPYPVNVLDPYQFQEHPPAKVGWTCQTQSTHWRRSWVLSFRWLLRSILLLCTVSSATGRQGWSVGIALQHASSTTHGRFSGFFHGL